MTLIANLDADIEQFYAEQGAVTREIQIFRRIWPLIPAMTSTTLAPLMQIQAAVQAQQSGDIDANDVETRAALFSFLGGVNAILSNVIREDVRDEFRAIIDDKGFPLGVLDKVIEAIMEAFDTVPLDSAIPPSPAPATVPLHVRLSTSGTSPEDAGDTSQPISSPTPATSTPPVSPAPQQPMLHSTPPNPPQPQAVPAQPELRVAEWDTEPTLQPYDERTALIPPSVQDVPQA